MTSVALTTNNNLAVTGQLLYRNALFSSRKATNTLLTLLKEAVMLPLPCANVIHKVSLKLREFCQCIKMKGISTKWF